MINQSNKKNILFELTDESKNLIKSYLKTNCIFFEWSGEEKTNMLSKYAKEFFSINYDFKTYEKKIAEYSNCKNVKIYYIPPSSVVEKETEGYESFQKFKNYIKFINILGIFSKKVDAIFINGKAVVECAQESLPHLSEDGVVFIYNFKKENYWKVLDYYSIEKSTDEVAVLKKKHKRDFYSSIMDRIFLIEKHLIKNYIN